jgi:hypothetical protein
MSRAGRTIAPTAQTPVNEIFVDERRPGTWSCTHVAKDANILARGSHRSDCCTAKAGFTQTMGGFSWLYHRIFPCGFKLAKNLELINKLASLLSAKYAVKELGDVAWFLGYRIIRDRKARLIWIVQDSYVSTMAERFGIEISNKKRLTLIKSGIELTKAPAGFNTTKQAKKQYQELVGSVM